MKKDADIILSEDLKIRLRQLLDRIDMQKLNEEQKERFSEFVIHIEKDSISYDTFNDIYDFLRNCVAHEKKRYSLRLKRTVEKNLDKDDNSCINECNEETIRVLYMMRHILRRDADERQVQKSHGQRHSM